MFARGLTSARWLAAPAAGVWFGAASTPKDTERSGKTVARLESVQQRMAEIERRCLSAPRGTAVPPTVLPAPAVKAFEDHGFHIERGCFSREEMVEWKRRVNSTLASRPQRVHDPSTGRTLDATTTGVSVWMAKGEPQMPGYFVGGLCSPRMVAVSGDLMGTRRVGTDALQRGTC
jgi:hypothetical protein